MSQPSTSVELPTAVDTCGAISRSFHLFMLAVCSSLFLIALAGFWYTGVWSFDTLPAGILLIPASLVPAMFWHDRKQYERRDAALTLFWAVIIFLVGTMLTPLFPRMNFPLVDSMLAKADKALGFYVPAIVAWTQRHSLMRLTLDLSYSLLGGFMILAILLPALCGKKQAAERFLLANGVCSVIALPFSTLLPAIGPWVGFHFSGSSAQALCEAGILALRANVHAPVQLGSGSVTCPSFHVIWAILSAQSLYSFRLLAPFVWPFALLVIISTVTTGWHYVVDVIAGIFVAAFSIWAAARIDQSAKP